MVLVELRGGLGNQMFEYALGRHIAEINRVPIRTDTETVLKGDPYGRAYALGVFRVTDKPASRSDILKAWTPAPYSRWRRGVALLRRALPRAVAFKVAAYGSQVWTEEEVFKFDPRVLEPTDNNVVIRGNWQNEKYFAGIADTIRREFALRVPLSPRAKEYARDAEAENTVAVHIRSQHGIAKGRPIAEAIKLHGCLPAEYYQVAMRHVTSRVTRPRFVVFADDAQWAHVNMQWPVGTIHVTGTKDYEDLTVMSRCKHQIIANSSFSWWSAWLNPNQGKIVVAPRAYVTDSKCDTSELYPQDWVVM